VTGGPAGGAAQPGARKTGPSTYEAEGPVRPRPA
jgi:hypothetical protein